MSLFFTSVSYFFGGFYVDRGERTEPRKGVSAQARAAWGCSYVFRLGASVQFVFSQEVF